MPLARLCPHCGQPVTGRCQACRAQRYGWTHQAERRHWEPIVAHGDTPCARAQLHGLEPHTIDPTQPWHLDHLPDGTRPSCAYHNDWATGA